MAKMSKKLQLFYRDINQWIIAGCPEHPDFKKNQALCASVEQYWTNRGAPFKTWVRIQMEMKDQFEAEGLHYTYPFNGRYEPNYWDEMYTGAFYKNPKRLEWIQHHDIYIETGMDRLIKNFNRIIKRN